MQETVLIPGSGRSPGKRNGYSLQYSYLENSMVRGYHGVTKGDTTEWLTLSLSDAIIHSGI